MRSNYLKKIQFEEMMSHHITFAGFPKACAYVVAFQEGRLHVHEQDHTKWLHVS
jgi:hypothetical protein